MIAEFAVPHRPSFKVPHSRETVRLASITAAVSQDEIMAEVERMATEVLMLKAGSVVDRGSPTELVGRYGRDNLEEVFLDIARDRAGHPR